MTRIISAEELSKHNRREDLWLAVGDVVYDMTEFAPTHPGGFDSRFPHSCRFKSRDSFSSLTHHLSYGEPSG